MSELRVGRLPGRERPCLYVESGIEIRVLASFVDEAAMLCFLAHRPMFTPPHPSYGDEPEREVETR